MDTRMGVCSNRSNRMKLTLHKKRTPYAIAGVLIGITFIFLGGYDDSPGAQLAGLVIILAAIVSAVRKTTTHDPN